MGLEKSDYTADGFKKKCAATLEKLKSLAKKAKVDAASIDPCEKAEAFEDFVGNINEEISRLRVENPGAETQRELDRERRLLDSALSGLTGASKELRDLQQEKRLLEKEHGTLGDLADKKKKLEKKVADLSEKLSQVDERMNVVDETIAYLENLDDQDSKAPCPACEQQVVPSRLLASLNALKDSTRNETEEFDRQKEEAQRAIKALGRVVKRLTEIVEEELPEAKASVAGALEELEDALGRKLGKDDPEVVVNKRLEEIQKEIEKNKKQLADYTKGLDQAVGLLDGAESIADVQILDRKIKKLNAVKKSSEWEEMNKARDVLNDELGLVDTVREAVEETLGEVSRKKVEEARDSIADIYRKLVERPDFSEIEIDPKNYEVYAVDGDKREKLITFFNQGDMNCAALAIFIALGVGRSGADGGASFMMLDDPSQSLDGGQKERLIGVLDEVAGSTQLVLSTMDGELMESAKKHISRKKKVYQLGEWDPLKGPSLTEA
jgi:DNA repair protein SbcC/Rad50